MSSPGGQNVKSRISSRSAAIAAVSAAILVPLGVFGAPALARSAAAASQYQYGGSSQYEYKGGGKVALCHHTHSKKHPWHVITVSSSAVKAHLKHGDTPAPCPAAPAAQQKHASHKDDDNGTQTTSGTAHGQSGDQHGKSGEQHGNSGEQHGQSGSHGNGHGK
jgi:hypothetical protein